jgi:arylsulfatase A-like enzyme
MVVTDDQREVSLDVMAITMDRVAGEGIRFTNGFVTTPICGPSRASILTGQAARNHGVEYNSALLFDPTSTLATWAQAAGYRTAMIGKYMNRYLELAPAVPPGWDHWNVHRLGAYYDYELIENGETKYYGNEPSDYATDVLRDDALRFVDENADQPFFMVLSTYAPHIHAVPAERHAGRLADTPPWRPASFLEADLSDKPGWMKWIRRVRTRGGPQALLDWIAARDEAHIRELESLLAVDEAVGAILDRLETHGLAEDTIVVFTSDNGLHWGEHWLGGKYNGYEESIRVPLLIRYPRLFREAREEDALVLNIDLAPTLAELAGIPIPERVDGVSMVELLCGDDSGWRQDFALEYFITSGLDGMPGYVGVRSERWKYIFYFSGFEELYDLTADPHEMDNLLKTRAGDAEIRAQADALAARLAELRAAESRPGNASRRPVRHCGEKRAPRLRGSMVGWFH